MSSQKIKVLFVCTGNSCRSQIAEGLLREIGGNQFDVFSAGSHPSRVHPNSIEVMREIGIDLSEHSSNHIDEYLNVGIDIVITVCDSAKEICPVFSGGARHYHWSIDDPFKGWTLDKNQLNSFRETREIIRKKIIIFIENRIEN